MNLVVLTGRLTREPELKYGQSGKAFCRFSLAVDRPFKKGEADFINCVAFGKTGELVSEYLKKGNKCGVQGRMQMNSYEKDGEKRTTYDVICDSIEFLESKNAGTYSDTTENHSGKKNSNVPPAASQDAGKFDNDDEFPF